MDAERYQEAYYSLVDEVGGLVDRNNLAEEEAGRAHAAGFEASA